MVFHYHYHSPMDPSFEQVGYSFGSGRPEYSNESQRRWTEQHQSLEPAASLPQYRNPEYTTENYTAKNLDHNSSAEMLNTETFVFDIRPKWTKKSIRTTPKNDELFKFNARAYEFTPGETSRELIINCVGEGNIHTEEESLPDLIEVFDDQALACHGGIQVEDLQEFWEREQICASWWAGNWIATGQF
ncbi:hypothetical protein N0V95_005909 [Ascochyta clinopodiicola]|nr:hypothetical protein N0V95_005909 [Ascochyta clinopodiicola]